MTSDSFSTRRNEDGSIDMDFYRQKARVERNFGIASAATAVQAAMVRMVRFFRPGSQRSAVAGMRMGGLGHLR